MNRFAPTLALVFAFGAFGHAPGALATDTVTTTNTTTYSGVVSEINPTNSTIIVKSEKAPAPVTYTYTKETAFVDSTGKVVAYETIRNLPVTVEYTKDGDRTIVKRVVATQPGAVIQKEETTTHTETH